MLAISPLVENFALGGCGGNATRKRSRESLATDACTACRRSKTRCSDAKPCPRCVRLDKAEACVPWCHEADAKSQHETPTPSRSMRPRCDRSTRACVECRLRKIGCDNARPCARCIRGRRTCQPSGSAPRPEGCGAGFTPLECEWTSQHHASAKRPERVLKGDQTSSPFALANPVFAAAGTETLQTPTGSHVMLENFLLDEPSDTT